MSDLKSRIVSLGGRVASGLRPPPGAGDAKGRLQASTRRAELAGLQFAFFARLTAIVIVTVWLFWIVPWPRDLYYGAYAFAFFLLGYIPYRLRHHAYGETIKLGFIVLDVALVTVAILLPPPVASVAEWPVQTRLRGQEFLYLLLLLAEAALTYSPRRVVWTGLWIGIAWSAGVMTIYSLPDTTRFNDVAAEGALASTSVLDIILRPTFVGLTAWYTQLVATALFTLLLTLTVWRGRRTLLSQVEAEVVRADLARYVSPDVAEALAKRGASGFGDPSTRTVAVLFADIVGFTKLTEPLSPERTFALLRSFQERSCAIVFKHGGTLDKYLGDGFMATFGALDLRPDASARALACAFELQQEIERWSRKRSGRGADPLRVSVGIHCGPVTVGNLGGRERVEFTVVGDVVNVASRLEEVTREVGGSIVASEDCLQAAGAGDWTGRFHTAREIRLRGRQRGTLVHIAE
ncbi:adenylate/guanylate cyclase domain-containing protein [Microvirga pudoricolor]|uniref:adenylate/guanylate cyclase domain-containing protein n=1 Tax=Microvirga pudoricolor TaxID=2778729 RepID=UPI00194DE101|nr:adenylate/guanylate cyclase domain-containing protein [Microvirga pudoricolor]MBM6593501.1 adenylate/guanylate cyclase domain-containing protein [Microvirga pudoricolor]